MEARIIDILEDGLKFILDKGKDDGITVGKTFMIVEPTDKDVVDPHTGKVLGKLEIPKGRIRIIYVRDKYSVAESDEYDELYYLLPLSPKRKRPITSAKVGDLAVEQ